MKKTIQKYRSGRVKKMTRVGSIVTTETFFADEECNGVTKTKATYHKTKTVVTTTFQKLENGLTTHKTHTKLANGCESISVYDEKSRQIASQKIEYLINQSDKIKRTTHKTFNYVRPTKTRVTTIITEEITHPAIK